MYNISYSSKSMRKLNAKLTHFSYLFQRSLCSVVAYVLDCNIVSSEFEL